MFHKIIIVGNLGQDPDMRTTPGGKNVTNMSIATNRSYTDGAGEKVEEVIWFKVAVWGKQAEAVHHYLRKGRQVLIEGRMVADADGNPEIWTRNDGTPAASFKVNAQTVQFLGGRDDKDAETGPATEEEIPF